MRNKVLVIALLLSIAGLFIASNAMAVTAEEIDAGVKRSLKMLEDVRGGQAALNRAAGALVFPAVFKAGIGLGGEYGEGALIINGKTVDYYNTAAASIGFQLGVQKKTIILLFMDKEALKQFQYSSGSDASVTVIAIGADGSIDTSKTNKPIVAFVFDQKGLMYNLSLEGAKITKIRK